MSKFEKNNNVSVKILGWDSDTEEIAHLRNGNGRYKLAITLFLYEGHYQKQFPSEKLARY